MYSGIPLTFQISSHTVLAEVLLFFSNTSFSFLLLLGEKLSSFKNWENWQESCGGIVKLGGINGCCQTVPYIIITEWSCQTWQAASGRFPLLPFCLLLPLLPSWKLPMFQATNGHNTSWSFQALHVTNPKITPQLQAILQSSRYWKLSLFNEKKKNSVLCNNFSYQTCILKDIRAIKKKKSALFYRAFQIHSILTHGRPMKRNIGVIFKKQMLCKQCVI